MVVEKAHVSARLATRFLRAKPETKGTYRMYLGYIDEMRMLTDIAKKIVGLA